MNNLTGYSHCPHCGGQSFTGGFAHTHDCPYVVGFAETRDSGWICPKCSRIWGPKTKGCEWCNNGMFDMSVTLAPSTVGGTDG